MQKKSFNENAFFCSEENCWPKCFNERQDDEDEDDYYRVYQGFRLHLGKRSEMTIFMLL